MAREVNFEDLNDDDIAYIRQRPWMITEASLQGFDIKDKVMEGWEPAPEGAATEEVRTTVEPDASLPENPDAQADDYDDEEAWAYADIQAEVKERKEAMGDEYDGPAGNASRADLVAWLREDNARD